MTAKPNAEKCRQYRERRKETGLDSRSYDTRYLETQLALRDGQLADAMRLIGELVATLRAVSLGVDTVSTLVSKSVDSVATPAALARTPDLGSPSLSLEKDTENPTLASLATPATPSDTKSDTGVDTKATVRAKPRTACPPSEASREELVDWVRRWKLEAFESSPEFQHFLDHHRAKRAVFADWAAAWRTWKKNEQRFSGPRLVTKGPPVQQAPATGSFWKVGI